MSEHTTGLTCALIGADSLLIECGEILLAKGHRIAVVATGSPKIATWAASKGLNTVDASGPAAQWQPNLAEHRFDWLFAITHLALLPDSVLDLPAVGAVNFHDGPLPQYAGLNTPAWALLRGEQTYGITWHVITSGVDEGDIVKARTFEVAAEETSLSLNTRNFEAAIETFDELVHEIGAGTLTRTPQDRSLPRAIFRRHDRPDALAVLDWRQPAADLERTVRALTFGPYPNPLGFAKIIAGDQVALVSAAHVPDDNVPDDNVPDNNVPDNNAAAEPGTILSVDNGTVVVACGDGQLALTGLASPTGQAITPRDLGLVAGASLALLSSADVMSATDLGRRLARAERRHLAELEALTPVELPWARTPSVEHQPAFDSVPLDSGHTESSPERLAAALGVVLSRLSGKHHFHLGLVHPDTPRSGWTRSLVSDSVPFAVTTTAGEHLGDALARLSDDITAAHRRAPFSTELIARYPSLAAVPELVAGRLLPLSLRLGEHGAEADADAEPEPGVVLELRATGDRAELRYDTGLVDRADVELLASCIHAVLGAAGTSPSVDVTRVDLLGPALRAQVLDTWNDTERDLPATTTPRLFEDQVDRTPEATAVVFEDRPVSYRELDERANRLAHHLIELGVGPDHLVGVHVPRGIELVVAVLGVHKAGGAYVPLDPVYPSDRLHHMIRDSGCQVILSESSVVESLPGRDDEAFAVVSLDEDHERIAGYPSTRPAVAVEPQNLSYCIYTSGSTGLPKGVLIEHRNVVNFFLGMDDRVPHELPATWFAVTSLSFDISVLELLYTLTRGFTVVVYLDRDRDAAESAAGAATSTGSTFVEQHADRSMGFSLFYFSGDAAEGHGSDKYRLLLEGARYADQHDFEAVWTPERHFHAFGGLYPNPAVTSAAVAAVTENIGIRAGSVVMPLHHPIRVAESWSIVDNLSNGRVAISVAAGWQPNDFVLMPQNYSRAKELMFEGVEQLKQLWRGEAVTFPGATDEPVTVKTLPRPVQPELPVWVTTAGNRETYIQAGRVGANVLTHLLGQSVEQLAPKIDAYRKARAEAGFDPDAGKVTLMLHTFVGDDDDHVRDVVRQPMKDYLGTSFSLLKEYAWSFPAFQRPAGEADAGLADEDIKSLSEEDLDAVLEFAFLRYFETSGLFGTPERCLDMVDRLKGIGVDEIACLVDFGVATDTVLGSLPAINRLRELSNRAAGETATAGAVAADQSVAAQLQRHAVTHFQCTPSMARMLLMQDESRTALAEVDNVFIGGEAFPIALARDLMAGSVSGRVTNMYGPTETTIWSTTWPLAEPLDVIPIGTPIANTRIYILDENLQPLPPGVAGNLWIGGAGVVRGYHARPELTAERFVADPFLGDGHRMYITGDLARWRRNADGTALLEFLGRIDHQVKIRGYRIELGEIEVQLGRFPGVLECVAVVREDTPGDQQLVGYVSPTAGATIDPTAVKEHLRQSLPDVMIPGHVMVLDALPHTPNGKIDRNALPSLAAVLGARTASAAPVEAGNDLERQVLKVWESTLGASGIGVNDNFFDIGGHSLLAVRMHRRLSEELDHKFPLTDVYRFPTVRSFAASLSSDAGQMAIDASRDRAARRRASLDRRRARR